MFDAVEPGGLAKTRPIEAHQTLGRRLRRLRESRKWTSATVARKLDISASKISRLENGENNVKETDIRLLLDLYEVHEPAGREAIMRFVRALNTKHWWQDAGVSGSWFYSYLTLESIAESIRTYETRFIPGLLQAPGYAEAIISRQFRNAPDTRQRVDTRMRRQREVFDSGARLWALVDEAALAGAFPDRRIMQDQIAFLIDAAQRPNVIIQILESDAAVRAGIATSFSLLRLPGEGFPDVVYLEHIDDASFFDSYAKSDLYRAAMEALIVGALNPQATAERLREAFDNLGSHG
jgi:transcriptional regulator with XRE-family HTH domain